MPMLFGTITETLLLLALPLGQLTLDPAWRKRYDRNRFAFCELLIRAGENLVLQLRNDLPRLRICWRLYAHA